MKSCCNAKAIESLHEKNSLSFCCLLQKVAEGLTIFLSFPPVFPSCSEKLGRKGGKGSRDCSLITWPAFLLLSLQPLRLVRRCIAYPWAWDSRKKWPMDRGACYTYKTGVMTRFTCVKHVTSILLQEFMCYSFRKKDFNYSDSSSSL